jgi:hypothetical protein
MFTQNFELDSYAIPSELHKTIRSVEDLTIAANDPQLLKVMDEIHAWEVQECIPAPLYKDTGNEQA